MQRNIRESTFNPESYQNMLADCPNSSDRGLKISQTVASISFFLLFPGYLFYHQSLAMGLIPPFAAGLFGYVSLGALLVLLALLPWNTAWLKNITGNRYVLWVLAFLFYTSAWTLAHYLLLDGDHISIAGVQSLETVIFWSSLFLIGLLLPIESGPLRWSLCISFAIILVSLLYFYIDTGTNMYNAQRLYGNTTDVSTYQGFARSVLFTLLVLLAVFNSFRVRAVFILGGVFILFMLISRSDFYAFLALSAVLCVILGIRQPKYFLLLLLVTLEVALLATPDIAPRIGVFMEALAPNEAVEAPVTGSSPATDAAVPPPIRDESGSAQQSTGPNQDYSSSPGQTVSPPITGQAGTESAPDKAASPPRLSRQFEVLDFSSSKSWKGRLALQEMALGQIMENPLLGKFGGHVLTEATGKFQKGHAGRYAHNALSAWVSYGLAGFLLYLALTLYGCLVTARHVILKRVDEPLWTFAFTLNLVCLLLVIVSKPVFWPLPALGWGVLAQALIGQAKDRG